MKDQSLTPGAVVEAARRLEGVVNVTPVMTSRTVDELTRSRVFLKCENFQRGGAFKFRGAYNAVSQLSQEQKAAGVITHSSGNHAQGLALAAKLHGVDAVIVMPDDAPRIKREAAAGYGARIISCRAIDREEVCAEEVAKNGYTFIHPYDNHEIIAGAGTAALEMFGQTGPLDVLFVPVGGGGLISGTVLAGALQSPGCDVIGVEPELGDDAGRSWRSNTIYKLALVPQTIADGLRTRFVGDRNLPIMRQYVADMITVPEAAIWEAMMFLWTRLKILVEPSSAVAFAPLLSSSFRGQGKRVGVIISGGNVDVLELAAGRAADRGETKVMSARPVHAGDAPREVIRPRVLVTDPVEDAALEILREVADVTVMTGLSEEMLFPEVQGYQGLLVGRNRPVTEQMLEYGFALKAIGSLSARLENVDVSTARNLGIEVCTAPVGRSVTIAEHTIQRLLRLATEFSPSGLDGKTLGIIGYGEVGREVAHRARAFGMRVLANQPRLTPQLALDSDVEVADLKELVRLSDFITLHVPPSRETEAILGRPEISLMRHTAFLINAGHTGLIDESALLSALDQGLIAGASLSAMPPDEEVTETAVRLREHERVHVAPHVTTIIRNQLRETSMSVATRLAAALRTSQVAETLSLGLVPIERVRPHEQVDPKRVERLMARLQQDELLVNPPVAIRWKEGYVILDGATRYTALKELGCRDVIVQIVRPYTEGFELHTWYHAISGEGSFEDLCARLRANSRLSLVSHDRSALQGDAPENDALCILLAKDGLTIPVFAKEGADRLTLLSEVVGTYTTWGSVERTLLTDFSRAASQFPRLVAVALFPQFRPDTVFDAASRGQLLPAGLTRFVIPGRILRLNADLRRLRKEESRADKQSWFRGFLQEKVARSRLRYYQEPVILLDE